MRHFNSWKLSSNQITVEKITASCNFLSFLILLQVCVACVLTIFWKGGRKKKKKKKKTSGSLLTEGCFLQTPFFRWYYFTYKPSLFCHHFWRNTGRQEGASPAPLTLEMHSRGMQPKAEGPHMHRGTSLWRISSEGIWEGRPANPSLLTDLNRQKLRHNSLGSVTPSYPLTLPWGLCDMGYWGTQKGCPELFLQDF